MFWLVVPTLQALLYTTPPYNEHLCGYLVLAVRPFHDSLSSATMMTTVVRLRYRFRYQRVCPFVLFAPAEPPPFQAS